MTEMWFISVEGRKIFPLSKMPILPVRPTQPPIQWVLGAVSPEMKLLGHEVDHLPRSSAEVNEWSCTSIPIHHCGMCSDFTFTFTFIFISHEHSPVTNCWQPHLTQFWNYTILQKIMIQNIEIIQVIFLKWKNSEAAWQGHRGTPIN